MDIVPPLKLFKPIEPSPEVVLIMIDLGYRSRHSRLLTYEGKNRKVIALPYWEVPAEVLEDREALAEWVDVSMAVSRRAVKIKKRG